MGTDIHWAVEVDLGAPSVLEVLTRIQAQVGVYTDFGFTWTQLASSARAAPEDRLPRLGRDYMLFWILAGLRGDRGVPTLAAVAPMGVLRAGVAGWPNDVTAETWKLRREWETAGYGHAAFTLEALEAYDWQQQVVEYVPVPLADWASCRRVADPDLAYTLRSPVQGMRELPVPEMDALAAEFAISGRGGAVATTLTRVFGRIPVKLGSVAQRCREFTDFRAALRDIAAQHRLPYDKIRFLCFFEN